MKEPKIGVASVIYDAESNKILLGHRADGTWGLVGGKLEWRETFEECAIREMMEEVGIELKKMSYLGLNNCIDHENDQHYVTVFYHATEIRGIYENKEPDKHYEWKMHSLDDLPDNLFFPLRSYLMTLRNKLKSL